MRAARASLYSSSGIPFVDASALIDREPVLVVLSAASDADDVDDDVLVESAETEGDVAILHHCMPRWL